VGSEAFAIQDKVPRLVTARQAGHPIDQQGDLHRQPLHDHHPGALRRAGAKESPGVDQGHDASSPGRQPRQPRGASGDGHDPAGLNDLGQGVVLQLETAVPGRQEQSGQGRIVVGRRGHRRPSSTGPDQALETSQKAGGSAPPTRDEARCGAILAGLVLIDKMAYVACARFVKRQKLFSRKQ
jgi:hypothetical protein